MCHLGIVSDRPRTILPHRWDARTDPAPEGWRHRVGGEGAADGNEGARRPSPTPAVPRAGGGQGGGRLGLPPRRRRTDPRSGTDPGSGTGPATGPGPGPGDDPGSGADQVRRARRAAGAEGRR